MKTKLRRLIINSQHYLYMVTRDYDSMTSGFVYLRIFSLGRKNTPLTVIFHTLLDPMHGNPFFTGIQLRNLKTGQTDKLSAHLPSLVRRFILYGEQNGWRGINKTAPIDGIRVLKSWGYDTSAIHYYEYDAGLKKMVLKNY